MADPLSIAASIAGLVTLADVVFDRLVKFGRSVKNADKEIQDLCKEINLLGGTLNSLARLARALEDGSFDTNLRMHHIENCSDTLREMNKKLKKLENPSLKQKLTWPFTKDRVKEWLDELSQHKAKINQALSANSLDAMLRLLAQDERHTAEILAEIKETRKITSRIHEDSHRRRVLDSFLKYNPQQNYDMSLQLRHPRTGLWLTRLPEFQQWLTTPDSKLWLKGIPGAGKTVLAASIIESTLERNAETTPSAFFFCDYKDTRTQIIENILAALVYQLAIQKEEAYGLLERYYDELHPTNSLPKLPSRRGLEKLLGKMLRLYDHAYLVIDGLDECGGSTAEVVESLHGISDDSDNVSMALLSRDEDDIGGRLGGDFVPVEIAAHKGDVTEYVTAEIEERIRTRKLHISGPHLKGEILQGLVDGAKGMFRWVACQLDHLGECDSDQQCREALKSLPPTLDETYARIIRRVPKGKQAFTELALNCIAYASPKLTIHQLREVLSAPKPGVLLKASAIIREESITRYCSSLIRKSTDGEHLELTHFSVQEFLEKDSLRELGQEWLQVSESRAYHLLAIECLRFIQLKNFHNPKVESETEEQIAFRNEFHPLYQYASEQWPTYARREWGNQMVFDLGASLFHPSKTSYFTSWATAFEHQFRGYGTGNGNVGSVVEIVADDNYTPLHMAATLALPQVCSFLVKEGMDVNLESPAGKPLQCAVQGLELYCRDRPWDLRWMIPELLQGNQQQDAAVVDTIRCLCQAGASLDFRCCYPFSGMTLVQLSLQMISRTDSFEILTALIQEGAFVEETDILGADEAFSKFWSRGPESEYEVNLETFLEFLDSYDSHQPGHYRISAMLWRHATAMELSITQNPMRVDTQISLTIDELKKQAQAEIIAGNLKNLERILRDPRFKADIFVQDDGNSLLDLAISCRKDEISRRVEVIGLLLEAGCDATKPNEYGMDLLQRWHWFPTMDNGTPTDEESMEFKNVARLLAKSGVSCVHQNIYGQNALHCHIKRPFLLDALLKYQAPKSIQKAMETVDNYGYAPLPLSLLKRCTQTSSILLAQKHAITPEMVTSPTPILSLAVSANDEASFEALLLSGVDFRFEGTETPLHYVGYGAKPSFVHRLRSLYPEACGHWYKGHTPLESYLIRCLKPSHQDMGNIGPLFIDELSIPDDLPNAKAYKALVWDNFACQILGNIRNFTPRWAGTSSNNRVEKISGLAITSLIRLGYLESYESCSNKSGLAPLLQTVGDWSSIDKIWPLSTFSISEVISRTRHWEFLRQSPQMIRLLKAAVSSKELELPTLMLEKGVSVHQRCDGSSVLETFVSQPSSEEMFDILLRYSDESLLNEISPQNNGLALIHLTGKWSFDWIVPKLVGHGANPNLRVAKHPNSPALVYHIGRGRRYCAIATLENGADPTLFDDLGYDAALAAALRGEVSVLRWIYNATKRDIKPIWHGNMDWHRRCSIRISNGATKRICTGVTALHLGAARQSTNVTRFYSNHKLVEDFDIESDEGYTPLHFAASHGSVENIEYLCARGCNVDARTQDGSSPLHLAVRNNEAESVRALVNAGCKSLPDSSGMTPLFYAYLYKDEELVALLDSVEESSGSARTDSHPETRRSKTLALVFREAVKGGDLQLCQSLVASGCDLETPLNDFAGGSLLTMAITLKEIEIVEWMLRQKVSITTPVSDSRSTKLAIHLLLEDADFAEVLPVSLENYMRNGGRLLGEAPTFVTAAVRGANVEGLKILLQHTGDNQDHYGRLWSMHPDTVVTSLVNEIEPSTEQTPLHVAAFDGNLIAAKLLLEWGAKVNPPGTVYQKSPLHSAIESLDDPQETVALFLIHEGADLESRDSWGRTPANLAAENSRMRSLRALITAKANPHTADEYSWTVLHSLAESESMMRWTIFAELVRLRVDPHRVNWNGKSAFHDAADTSDTVSLLVNSDLFDLEDAAPYPWNSIASVQQTAFISTAYPLFRKRYGRQALQRFANLMPTGMESPLCRAAKQGSVLALEHLIELGASMDREGCPVGSALMAACESGSLGGVEFLVRRGAALSYVGPNGNRSAYVSAKKNESILRWLLVNRFVDQQKLTNGPHHDHPDDDMNHGLFSWSGPVKAELVISGRAERLHHESSRGYWSRLMKEKMEWRGKIPPLNSGRRTVFRSCLVPQEIVRVHPQGYNSDEYQKDWFSKKMGTWRQKLRKDSGCWYISYADAP